MNTKPEMKTVFTIVGAKYESNGALNYKYVDCAFTKAEALDKYKHKAQDYPYSYCRLEVRDEDGNKLIVKTLMGECTDEELITARMRMSVASLWMTVTGALFVDIAADPEEQLAIVEKYIRTMKKGK